MVQSRRWRICVAAVAALTIADVIGLAVVGNGDDPGPARPAAVITQVQTPRPSLPQSPTASPAPAFTLAANSVAIPSEGVTAPVERCVISNWQLAPPADVHRTCSWAGGSELTADAGTTVITGHINYVGQGTGALGNIGKLTAGSLVYTSGATGVVTQWRVVAVSQRQKTTGIDRAAFVGRHGTRQLYLITCGGDFDWQHGDYLANTYVLAVPTTATVNASSSQDQLHSISPGASRP